MSVVKYIGRKTDFKGKTLWEIVGNLKGGGVGRIVVRSMFERYPEPSFMKILKVEADVMAKPRKCKVLVERTFRGKLCPRPVLVHSTSYKADYRLIPKDEEEEYCKITKAIEERVMPSHMEFPPLLKEMVLKDYEKRGEKKPDELLLSVKYVPAPNSHYKKGPTEVKGEILSIGLGKPASPELYSAVLKG